LPAWLASEQIHLRAQLVLRAMPDNQKTRVDKRSVGQIGARDDVASVDQLPFTSFFHVYCSISRRER
jgi:hypothetical protein